MQYEVAKGSIIGRDHVFAGKNNQDAYSVLNIKNGFIAVVTDGCSSGKYSEVGANLGASWLINILLQVSQELELKNKIKHEHLIDSKSFFWETVRFRLLSKIQSCAEGFIQNKAFREIINEYFLFSIVGMYMDFEKGLYIFSIGDGYYAVNSEVSFIEPNEGNRPPYLAYELLRSSLTEEDPGCLKFRVHKFLPVDEFQSCLIGTDGIKYFIDAQDKNFPGKNKSIGSLSQFWEEDRYFSNSDNVRRILFLANKEYCGADWKEKKIIKEYGRLPDDTTLISVRRKKGGVKWTFTQTAKESASRIKTV